MDTLTLPLLRTSAAALLGGALLGAVWAFAPLGVAGLLLAALAIPAAWAMIRKPAWTLSIFWLAYCLQSTVFAAEFSVKGAFYPLYAMILLNGILFLGRARENPLEDAGIFQFTVSLACFVAVALAAVLNVDRAMPEYPFGAYQRLFVYSLGLLAALQFWLDENRRRFVWVVIGCSATLSGWVIMRALRSGFGYRAGTGVNENYVAEIIAVGLLALLVILTGSEEGRGLVRRTLLWGCFLGGVYALTLLASRGMFVGFGLVGTVVLLWRVRPFARVLGVLVLIALVGLVVAQLPGTQGLLDRFAATNVYTFNERIYIWRLVTAAIGEGSTMELLLGHGLGTTTSLVNSSFSLYNSTHNAYLQLLYEFGVLGLCAFLASHLLPLRRLLERRDVDAVTGGAMLMFMMICAMHGTEADNFQYWIVLGYAAAVAFSAAPSPVVFYRLTLRPHALTLASDRK